MPKNSIPTPSVIKLGHLHYDDKSVILRPSNILLDGIILSQKSISSSFSSIFKTELWGLVNSLGEMYLKKSNAKKKIIRIEKNTRQLGHTESMAISGLKIHIKISLTKKKNEEGRLSF